MVGAECRFRSGPVNRARNRPLGNFEISPKVRFADRRRLVMACRFACPTYRVEAVPFRTARAGERSSAFPTTGVSWGIRGE